jgi:hypothetical protein
MKALIPQEVIENKIYLIRRQKVMIDSDLANLYGVTTRNLKRQVRRNIKRFPQEFMFQLTKEERNELVPIWHQFKTRKHTHTLPYAFTEHGIIMLSAVLNSERAIDVSIMVVKTFIRLRKMIVVHKEFAAKLKELELKVQIHDKDIILIFRALNKLMAPPEEKPKHRIGFHTE